MELRSVRPGELAAFAETVAFAFGERFDPAEMPDLEAVVLLKRMLGAREDGAWVGCSGAFPFELAVPGGALPAAGVTAVAVLPTHRRRGLLTEMMNGLLAQAREHEEPLAILWASESSIYGRFGFGMAAPELALRVARAHARFRPGAPEPPGRVVAVPAGPEAAARLAPVYAAEQARRPGAPTRSETWWRHMVFGHEGGDVRPRRLVVYEGASGDEGYALHRVTDACDEEEGIPDGTVEVIELIALTPAAASALWRFLLAIDLMARVVAWTRPPDDALPHLLADPGRLQRRLREGLFVRVLDPPRALAARRYAVPGRVVLEVAGEGTWALQGGPDGAECRASGASPDIALAPDALGALYLGGMAPGAMEAAGRLEERTPRAVARLHAMLAWPVAPWCPFRF